jgi:ribosomal protein L32
VQSFTEKKRDKRRFQKKTQISLIIADNCGGKLLHRFSRSKKEIQEGFKKKTQISLIITYNCGGKLLHRVSRSKTAIHGVKK